MLPQLSRVLLTVTTSVVSHSDLRCDSRQSVLSRIIPSRHDFASPQSGAVIAPGLTTMALDIESYPLSEISRNPEGAYWSFRGNSGTFGVVLSAPNVLPSHIVIQHQLPSNFSELPSELLPRAPRQVIVWGLVDGEKNIEAYNKRPHDAFALASVKRPPFSMRKDIFIPLAEFKFDIRVAAQSSMRQAFPLFDEVRSWGMDFGVMVFHVRNNWGADETLLCSVHIYGCLTEMGV